MADPSKSTGSKKLSSTAAFQMRTAPKPIRYLKLMVYGQHGAGKTTLAASAVDVPQMRDVLFIDAEKGEMSIDENNRIQHAELISRIQIDNFKAAASVQEFLVAHCAARDRDDIDKLRKLESLVTGIPPEEIEKPKRFQTVIIDSLSEIEEFCIYQLLKLSTDAKVDDVEEMDVAGWPEFRKNKQMMELVMRAYRDLPMNVIFLTRTRYTQDEMKKKFFAPGLTGQLASTAAGFMDVVGYLQTGNADKDSGVAPRRLTVQPVGNFVAKNRRSIFKKPWFADPVMADIMQGLGLKKD